MSPKFTQLSGVKQALINLRHKAVFSRFTQITVWMLQLIIYPHIKFIPQSLGITSDSPTGTEHHGPTITMHTLCLLG